MSSIKFDGVSLRPLKAAGCGVFTGTADAYLSVAGYKSDAERNSPARPTDGSVLRPRYIEFVEAP